MTKRQIERKKTAKLMKTEEGRAMKNFLRKQGVKPTWDNVASLVILNSLED